MFASSELGARPAAAAEHRLVGLAIMLELAAATTSAALIAGGSGGALRAGLGALALIILIGVARPARVVAVALAGLVALGQAAVTTAASGAGPVLALLGSLGLLAVGVVADALGAAIRAERVAREEAARIVEALRPADAVVGVTKWSHARVAFDRELARARRHGLPLSVDRNARRRSFALCLRRQVLG